MGVRLEPHDEGTHPAGDDPTFNESMYLNAVDPTTEVATFVRIGNRPNEGMAEVTTCTYLPDGRAAFSFQRPTIEGNDRFEAGGLRIEVTEPFAAIEADFDGKVCLLDDPLAMADPKAAFTSNPWVPSRIELRATGLSPMFGGEPTGELARHADDGFAKAHYEQLIAVQGSVAVDGEEHAIDGYGLRDHSWGPRTWQAPWYYRWLTGNVGGDFGFMASRVAKRDGPGTQGGFVWEGGDLHLCDRTEITTTWTDDGYHRAVAFTLHSGERSWSVTGEVLGMVPLRNRREGQVTRIAEGLTRWTTDDGRTGYGLAEYLDQLVDGAPVGRDE